MKTAWLIVALGITAVAPARADLTLETKMHGGLLIFGGSMRTVEQIRPDRSRVETWETSSALGSEEKERHTIQIIREDLHLRWELHPELKTYSEFPWPDTAGRDTTGEEDPRSDIPKDTTSALQPKRTGERRTINGVLADRYFIHSKESRQEAPALEYEIEMWVLADKDTAEITRLLNIQARHQALSGMGEGDPGTPPPHVEDVSDADSPFRGVPVRLTYRTFFGDSTHRADMTKEFSALPPDTLEKMKTRGMDIDPKTGALTVAQFDISSLHLGPIADEVFNVPRGYSKTQLIRPQSPR